MLKQKNKLHNKDKKGCSNYLRLPYRICGRFSTATKIFPVTKNIVLHLATFVT